MNTQSSSSRRAIRGALRAAAMVGAVVVLLSGCATAGTPAAGATASDPPTGDRPVAESTAFPVPSPIVPVLPAADGTPVPVPLSPEAPAVPAEPLRCADEQLELAVEALPDESGAGQSGFNLRFRNVSAEVCTVWGWPGVSAVGADGTLVGFPAQAVGGDGALVTLPPDVVAISHVAVSAAGAYGCPAVTAVGLRAFVTSDGAGPGVTVEHEIVVCGDTTSTMRQSAFAPAS
ncbi:DUF4232 domain-containing protein [Kitasatospora indigofera]|uniref:DUF4232 domain-containing protein n=1 Tax=Kitasatospora indigofera TaxID=67307 RepID=UPI00369BC91C